MEVQVISNTVQKFNGESYYYCGSYFQRKGKRLHRAVWEFHNGEIPNGYHIHHKDENRHNNDINNLELVYKSDHLSHHMSKEERKEVARESIKKAIATAPEWHRSAEGREWHSAHGKEAWEHREPITYTCVQCGKTFQTKNIYGKGVNQFCSNNCKSAYRRASGVDNEERTCPVCGKTFVVNRYSKNITCSRECGRERRWGSLKSKA